MELRNGPQPDYPVIFRSYVANGIQAAKTAVATGDSAEIAQIIQRIVNVAYFSLGLPEMWDQTRDLILSVTPRIERVGYWVEWASLLEQAASRSEHSDDRNAFAELSLGLGRLNRLLANYDEARRWLEAAEDAFAELKDYQGIARSLYRRAQNEQVAGDLVRAEILASKALTLFDEADPERGGCYTVLGTVAFVRTEWEQSEHFYLRAIESRGAESDQNMLAWAHADLGAALMGLEKYEDAIKSYQRALSLFDSHEAPVQDAVFRLNLSAVYLHMEQSESALELCLEIEPVFRRIVDERRLIMTFTNIGIAYQQLGLWEQAEQALHEAVQIARKREFYNLLTNAIDQIGMLFMDWGRNHDAVAKFDEALSLVSHIESERVQEAYSAVITEHRETAAAAVSSQSQ